MRNGDFLIQRQTEKGIGVAVALQLSPSADFHKVALFIDGHTIADVEDYDVWAEVQFYRDKKPLGRPFPCDMGKGATDLRANVFPQTDNALNLQGDSVAILHPETGEPVILLARHIVRDADEIRVLVKGFSGCDSVDVVLAVDSSSSRF